MIEAFADHYGVLVVSPLHGVLFAVGLACTGVLCFVVI